MTPEQDCQSNKWFPNHEKWQWGQTVLTGIVSQPIQHSKFACSLACVCRRFYLCRQNNTRHSLTHHRSSMFHQWWLFGLGCDKWVAFVSKFFWTIVWAEGITWAIILRDSPRFFVRKKDTCAYFWVGATKPREKKMGGGHTNKTTKLSILSTSPSWHHCPNNP